MFEVEGRVSITDAFSGPLEQLAQKARAAEGALAGLNGPTEMKGAGVQLRSMLAQIEQMQTAAKGGGGIDLGLDPAKMRAASAAMSTVRYDMTALAGAGKGLGGVTGVIGQMAPGLASLGSAGVIGGILAAVGAVGALALSLDVMGEQSQQIEARFRAFSGGAYQAAANMKAMDAAIGGAATKDEKMAMISRIMSLELAKSGAEAANVAKEALILGDASGSAMQRLETWTQMLATGQTRGLAQFGISVTEARKRANELQIANRELTDQEANAAAMHELAAGKMALVEKEGGKAATTTQELRIAWEDLKDAMADKITPTIEPVLTKAKDLLEGPKNALEGEEKSEIQRLNEYLAAEAALKQAIEVRRSTTIGANKAEEEALILGGVALAPPEDLRRQQEAYIADAQAKRDAAAASLSAAAAFRVAAADYGLASKAADEQKKLAAAADAMNLFRKSMDDAIAKGSGVDALNGMFAQLVGQVNLLSKGVPALPKIGDNLMAFDGSKIRSVVADIEALDARTKPAGDKLLAFVSTLEAQQSAAIRAATALGSPYEALSALAVAAGAAGQGILYLYENFDQLSGPAQQAVVDIGGVAGALDALNAKANQPITIGVAVSGLEKGLGDIDAIALRLTNVYSPEQVRAARDAMRSDFEASWATMGKTDKLGMDILVANKVAGYETMAKNTQSYYSSELGGLKKHNQDLVAEGNSVKSRIESVLSGGTQVTAAQMLAAGAGTYEDQAMESARRLAAIAARGQEELKKHPDWAGFLKIPPDVLAGNDAQLKAWASQTQEDVQNLSRPDLINWDAFVSGYRKKLDMEAAKDVTIDIAVGKLDAAGLLSGSTEDRKKKVAQALGLEAPTITFDSKFKVAADAGGKMMSDLTGGKGYIEVEVRPVLPPGVAASEEKYGKLEKPPPEEKTLPPTGADFRLLTPPAPERLSLAERMAQAKEEAKYGAAPQLPMAGLTSLPMDKIGPSAQAAEGNGQDTAHVWMKGWQSAFAASNVALPTVQSLRDQMGGAKDSFQAIGTASGHEMGGSFVEAVFQDVGKVRHGIAVLVAPEVAEILASRNRGGEKP